MRCGSKHKEWTKWVGSAQSFCFAALNLWNKTTVHQMPTFLLKGTYRYYANFLSPWQPLFSIHHNMKIDFAETLKLLIICLEIHHREQIKCFSLMVHLRKLGSHLSHSNFLMRNMMKFISSSLQHLFLSPESLPKFDFLSKLLINEMLFGTLLPKTSCTLNCSAF